MEVIGIFGTSGMAREAGDIAWALGLKPIYIARDVPELNDWRFSDTVVLEAELTDQADFSCVIGVGDNKIRQTIAEKYSRTLKFRNLIHPSATCGFGQAAMLDSAKGLIISAGARLTNNIQMGDFCIVNQNATVAHDCVIGNFVHIAPCAAVLGNVWLQDGAWIGAGAVVNQGTDAAKTLVQEGAFVGSGAVVLDGCSPNSVYVGVPAKRIK